MSVYAKVSVNDRMKSEVSTIVTSAATPDGFMMQNGKMMMVNDGKFTPMERDITLPNGMKVMKSGSYMPKGGTKTELKEGDHIDMEGNVTHMNSMDNTMDQPKMPEKDMNMPDTMKMKDYSK